MSRLLCLPLWVQLAALVVMPVLPVPLNVYADHQVIISLPGSHGPVPLPVSNSTRSFWIDSPGANPLAKEGSEGALTADADICIIGSGITGVSAAYHLSKALADETSSDRPLKVVILEARDFCSGATGRNGGHLTPAVFGDFKRHSELYGTEEALRGISLEQHTALEIVEIIKEHELDRAVDLVEGGHIDLMFTAAEVVNMREDYETAKEAGANVTAARWLDKDEVKAHYGSPFPGVWIPGHNLWPLKFVTEVYKLAASSPLLTLKLHTNTPAISVTPLSKESAHRWSVNTERGSVQCSYVLHATNGYVSHLLPHMQGPAGVTPTRGQVIAVRADATTETLSQNSWSGNEGFEYWFPRPVESGEKYPLVILGGGREVARPAFELNVVDDSETNEQVGEALMKFLPSVFPGHFQEGKEPEMEWSGIMGFTTSGDPFIGPVIDPTQPDSAETFRGQFIAAGYSGHGMPRAFACADVAARMIAAEITRKSFTPPDWFPRHYIPQI